MDGGGGRTDLAEVTRSAMGTRDDRGDFRALASDSALGGIVGDPCGLALRAHDGVAHPIEQVVELVVEGMHCGTCPITVRTAARSVPGVVDVQVTMGPGRARVRYRPSEVDETLETSAPGVFAAGDVIGEPAFVYTAAYEGRLAADNALGTAKQPRDYRALPD